MRGIGAVAAIALLLASAGATGGTRLSGQELAWIERNKDQLRGQLKDGDSAKFRNVTVSYKMNGKMPIVCGEVSSRNSFGA
jgi:hypothetical protein